MYIYLYIYLTPRTCGNMETYEERFDVPDMFTDSLHVPLATDIHDAWDEQQSTKPQHKPHGFDEPVNRTKKIRLDRAIGFARRILLFLGY